MNLFDALGEAMLAQSKRSEAIRAALQSAFGPISREKQIHLDDAAALATLTELEKELTTAHATVLDSNKMWNTARDLRRSGQLDDAAARFMEINRLHELAIGALSHPAIDNATRTALLATIPSVPVLRYTPKPAPVAGPAIVVVPPLPVKPVVKTDDTDKGSKKPKTDDPAPKADESGVLAEMRKLFGEHTRACDEQFDGIRKGVDELKAGILPAEHAAALRDFTPDQIRAAMSGSNLVLTSEEQEALAALRVLFADKASHEVFAFLVQTFRDPKSREAFQTMMRVGNWVHGKRRPATDAAAKPQGQGDPAKVKKTS